MGKFHRLKHSFTAGELSPLMEARVDFKRFANGCRVLYNAVSVPQGAAKNRSGFQFIYDIRKIGAADWNTSGEPPDIRLVPFIYNEDEAFMLIFFKTTDGKGKIIFGIPGQGLLMSGGVPYEVILPSGWDYRRFDYSQSADVLYIAQSGVQQKTLKRYSTYDWRLEDIVFTNPPSTWGSTDGYPERVTFQQQRLCYAANNKNPQTVWMSKSGSFHDFGTTASPPVDSDAIAFALDSGTQNKIYWLQSTKELSIGTMGNEWTVIGGTMNALTPSNILARKQTNMGSEPVQSLPIGNAILFIEKHGRAVNEFSYSSDAETYSNYDISILAPHLTEEYHYIDWCYQQSPYSIIWCVRNDGVLTGLTYQREHEVVGWHRHETDGKFLAVGAIPGVTNQDELWSVVFREVNNDYGIYVERMAPFFVGTDFKNSRIIDSYVVHSGSSTAYLPGFDHLVGKELAVLANGAVHPPVTVDSSGGITLNAEYEDIVAGLPYISEVRPFVPDIPTPTGTSMGKMQRISAVDLLLYNTIGLWIGKFDMLDGEYEEELPFRYPFDVTNEPIPPFSGVYRWLFSSGFERRTEYFIRQKDPLPFTLLGVIDTIEVTE